MTYEFNEQGQRLYYCLVCMDLGWVHPVVNGRPDYTHVRRCICKVAIEKQKDFPVDHAEKPSKKK